MTETRIDLHMHSKVSDGTDTPTELFENVKKAGMGIFALTDHDATKGCLEILPLLKEGDPVFIPGVEFSCKDEKGKYHILGLGYEPGSESIEKVVARGHAFRMKKVLGRIEFLKERFGFVFPQEDIDELLAMDNPGKPHIGNLMVKHGYAETRRQAIQEYIDQLHFKAEYFRPEDVIAGILDAGGIPVLAHPTYGSGDQLIIGDELDGRLRRLKEYGIKGLEAFYSGFTEKMSDELLDYAERMDFYVTAGSDYHGANKLIAIGDTGYNYDMERPTQLERFLNDVRKYNV